MKEHIVVTGIEAIEWYDGIVSGFVHTKRRNFLCLLLAFDADLHRRRFALLPVESSTGVNPTLEEFAQFVKTIFESATANATEVYLTSNEPMTAADVEIERAASSVVSNVFNVRIPCIDQAVLPDARERWLS
jgi:hypothetical protein